MTPSIWDPGDGSDVVEGQDDADTMLFNGAGVGENFDVSANGNRLRFFRTQGAITMDMNDTEFIDVQALGGADNAVVNAGDGWVHGVRSPFLAGETEANGLCACLRTRADLQFAKDRGDMVVDRALRKHESFSDLAVAQPSSQEGEDLELARRQPGRVPAGCRTWPPRQASGPALAQASGNDGRRRPCSQLLQLFKRAPLCVFVVCIR
jgi:hypothetical protein